MLARNDDDDDNDDYDDDDDDDDDAADDESGYRPKTYKDYRPPSCIYPYNISSSNQWRAYNWPDYHVLKVMSDLM